jgi:hypothetical protein
MRMRPILQLAAPLATVTMALSARVLAQGC